MTKLDERRKELAAQKKLLEKKAEPKVFRIRMTELKKMIREEARRARILKEQGRPVSIPRGRPFEIEKTEVGRGRPSDEGGHAYDEQEFLDYLRAGLKSGRGRPQEFDVDTSEELIRMSDQQILDSYDESGSHMDIYGKDGDILANLPLNLELAVD